MESRPVQLDFMVDEATGFGRGLGVFVKFDEAGQFAIQAPEKVADAYLEAGAKIPAEFGEVRAVIEAKINALQAVL